MSDLTLEGIVFGAYTLALIALVFTVFRVAFRDAQSSPPTVPQGGGARETSPTSRAPASVPAPFVPPGAGNGRFIVAGYRATPLVCRNEYSLRLVDELDAVVIRLDDWRGGSGA